MNQIHKLIEELKKRSYVEVSEEGVACLVVIGKGGDLICEVTIPDFVLEWYASVKDQRKNKVIWQDWMDYEGYDDRAREELEAEMAGDVLAFINRVLRSGLRPPFLIYKTRL